MPRGGGGSDPPPRNREHGAPGGSDPSESRNGGTVTHHPWQRNATQQLIGLGVLRVRRAQPHARMHVGMAAPCV
jgi:hypothetical protein